MSDIKSVWGCKREPYMQYDRVQVYYTKNDKDQNAIFMNYATDGEPDYKLIEDNHYARNRLNDREQKYISDILNNNEIIIKGE